MPKQSWADWLQWRRSECAALRSELADIRRSLVEVQRECLREVRADLRRYNPDEPRVPAGHSDGGQWMRENGGATSGDAGEALAQNKITPRGFTVQQVPGRDPLDPQGLYKPISEDEQQKIANALTFISNGDLSTLNPHVYENYPHPITGAVLPPSAQGYTAYDVPGFVAGRGVNRIVVDNATDAIYYTNNHYFSFYPVQLHERGE